MTGWFLTEQFWKENLKIFWKPWQKVDFGCSYDVMMKCWKENPVDRPTFSQLATDLDKLFKGQLDGAKYQKLIKSQTLKKK